jgi:hypothetical protein
MTVPGLGSQIGSEWPIARGQARAARFTGGPCNGYRKRNVFAYRSQPETPVNTLVEVLANLFWGVTVGGLTSAVSILAIVALSCGATAGGCLWWMRRRKRS